MKLHTRLLLSSIFAALLTIVSTGNAADKHHGPAWTYEGAASAEHWGDLDKSFATCKLGKEQSPIDIQAPEASKLASLGFAYLNGDARLLNNGHTIQVNLSGAGGLIVNNDQYQLLQFHFHTPSEERINGKSYPMVAHLVHKNGKGELAVVAVFFEEGAAHPALDDVFTRLPEKAGSQTALVGGLNPRTLIPDDRAYYSFMGSLTIPPCSEGVRWQVMKQPLTLSKAQLNAFRKLYPMNARPVQPLNGRKIMGS